jgi:hypothetical protein
MAKDLTLLLRAAHRAYADATTPTERALFARIHAEVARRIITRDGGH